MNAQVARLRTLQDERDAADRAEGEQLVERLRPLIARAERDYQRAENWRKVRYVLATAFVFGVLIVFVWGVTR